MAMIRKMFECLWARPIQTPPGKDVTDRDILAAFEPWTLACAVGAENGTTGSSMGFETWLFCSRRNWLPKVRSFVTTSDARIENALRGFVAVNCHKDYQIVLREQESARGLRPSCVLAPGESVTVSVPLTPGVTTLSSADIEASRAGSSR